MLEASLTSCCFPIENSGEGHWGSHCPFCCHQKSSPNAGCDPLQCLGYCFSLGHNTGGATFGFFPSGAVCNQMKMDSKCGFFLWSKNHLGIGQRLGFLDEIENTHLEFKQWKIFNVRMSHQIFGAYFYETTFVWSSNLTDLPIALFAKSYNSKKDTSMSFSGYSYPYMNPASLIMLTCEIRSHGVLTKWQEF